MLVTAELSFYVVDISVYSADALWFLSAADHVQQCCDLHSSAEEKHLMSHV